MAKKKSVQNMKDNFDCCERHPWHHHKMCGGGAVYGLGFIGAAVYYISNATGFWMGVLGLLKALVWPAFLVFHALKFLGM